MVRSQTIGLFSILITALLWSFLGLLSKICLSHGLDPFVIATCRAIFGCIGFLGHCIVTKTVRIPVQDALVLMLYGVFGIGVYYACIQYTTLTAGASMDVVLEYTAPFWVALCSCLLFHERIRPGEIVILLVATAGTVCVCLSGGSLPDKAPVLGIVTGLTAGICYASHFPFTRIWQKKYHSGTIFCYMLLGGSVALLVLNGIRGQGLPSDLPVAVWLCALCMGLVCTYVAYVFFGFSLQKISLLQAVITSELEPVLSIVWVCVFFDERFSPIGWLGSALILSSVFCYTLLKAKHG